MKLPFAPPFAGGLPEGNEAVSTYANTVRNFYDSRARWHRRFYRLSGIYLIVSGSALPVLASLTFTGKDLTIAIVGASVAVFTSLRGFYRWDQSWILLRRTEMSLTNDILRWRIETSAPGADQAKLDEALLNDIFLLRKNESDSFFKDISAVPSTGNGSRSGKRNEDNQST